MIEDTKKNAEDVGGAGDFLTALETDQVADNLPASVEAIESNQRGRIVSCILLHYFLIMQAHGKFCQTPIWFLFVSNRQIQNTRGSIYVLHFHTCIFCIHLYSLEG